MRPEEQVVPAEHADEASGSGGADPPEEAVGEAPGEGADQDSGPKSAEQLEQEPERDRAEG